MKSKIDEIVTASNLCSAVPQEAVPIRAARTISSMARCIICTATASN